ncbi:periplasmic binding protein-like II [Xylariaceae sp. FL1019]|nr:periplasmic binding protein-like II [Xylariaceae sp. FL1019]
MLFVDNGTVSLVNGGIPSLVSDTTIDLGANSETQLLRQYASHRNLRTVITTAEVYYRIVASKRAGINTLADLKGKRIGAVPSARMISYRPSLDRCFLEVSMLMTSSEYFVQTYLATVGLNPEDYTIVSGAACLQTPCSSGTYPSMLSSGGIDAIAMWEPSVQLGAEALGSDAVVFGDNQTTYREIYNLATTAEKLANPAKRAEIVQFVRALVQAEAIFMSDPDQVVARAALAVKTNATLFREVWPIHHWTARNPPDLIDVLVEEDKYVARQDHRTPIARDVLADIVDTTVLADAMKGL